MAYYWEPASIPKKKSSNGTKIIAAIVIMLVVMTTGLIFVTNPGSQTITPQSRVRVAVLDSGVDIDLSLQGRVVASASFVTHENGYDIEDLSTTDSKPDNVPHGTLISKQLVTSPNIDIVNGKVMGASEPGRTPALVAAIEWAIEQNASVINLSLGGSQTLGDPLETTINWAFSQGVIVVTSAGNSGDYGNMGTTIDSPALFEACIAVGALMEDGTPAYFSSIGPTGQRYIKPDIVASGYTTSSDGTRYYGTSFSSPRVAAAAAVLIGVSLDNNITYTPGSIMTALMLGADPVGDYPDYIVGAGKLNLQQSANIIMDNAEEGDLPSICYAFPGELPIDYEQLFTSDTYDFNVRMFAAGTSTFTTEIESTTPLVFDIPTDFEIDQIGRIPITVNIPDSGVTNIEGNITFTSPEFGECALHIAFDVGTPVARVAFDISHTTWDIDTTYGQFREYYKYLVDHDVSVSEIRNSTATTNSSLHEFDAVVILDPCVYGANETDIDNITAYILPFTEAEKQAYEDYYNSGGGIFVVSLGESSTNITSLNDFLDWTGFSLSGVEVPSGTDPTIIDSIDSHIITSGINGFHYLGATIRIPFDGHRLARYGGMPVLGCKENSQGGKFVLTGSNFFIDNYGILQLYNGASDNAMLGLRIVLWCAGKLF